MQARSAQTRAIKVQTRASLARCVQPWAITLKTCASVACADAGDHKACADAGDQVCGNGTRAVLSHGDALWNGTRNMKGRAKLDLFPVKIPFYREDRDTTVPVTQCKELCIVTRSKLCGRPRSRATL